MTVTVDGPGGISIDFPDGTDPATIHSAMMQATGQWATQQPDQPAPAQQPNVAADVAKSIGTGLVKGGLGVLEFPGFVRQKMDDFAGTIVAGGENLVRQAIGAPSGAPPTSTLAHDPIGRAVIGAGDAVNAAVDPLLHQPETTAGRYASTAAEFVPAAVSGKGAVKIGEKVFDAIKYGVAPGLASEAAGQATAGTPLEGPARFAAALATGGVAGAAEAGAAAKKAAAAIPTGAEIKAQSQSLYDATKASGITVEPRTFGAAVTKIADDVKSEGIDPAIHPKASAALARLEATAASGQPVSLPELDTLRKVIGQASKSIDPADRFMAGRMIEGLDGYVNKLTTHNVVGAADPATAIAQLNEARRLWKIQAKTSTVEGLVDRAEERSAASQGLSLEAALRGEFRNLALKPKEMARFTPDERRAIVSVSRGGPVQSLLSKAGTFSLTGRLGTLVSLGVDHALGGVPGMVGGVVAGEIGKRAAGGMARQKAEGVSALIRSGGKLPPVNPPKVLKTGLGTAITSKNAS